MEAGLAGLELLSGATPAQIEALGLLLTPAGAVPGEILGREGEPADNFVLVLDGRVEVTVATSAGPRRLAQAGPGAILGELGLLRQRPRSATFTALTACRLLRGGAEALETLLGIGPVRERLQRIVSHRLAEDLRPVPVPLGGGGAVLLRPLLPTDRAGYEQAVADLSDETVRRRYFSPVRPSPTLLDRLLDIDYVDHFVWAVLTEDGSSGVAAGRYVRQAGTDSAEVAFTTVEQYQGRGVATLLLGALGVAALEAGIGTLSAHVLAENAAMRAVLAKAGAKSEFVEPGVVLSSFESRRAAGVLPAELRERIAAAVHDVVTAGSLAVGA